MAMHMMYSLKPKIILGYKSLLHEQTVRLNRCTEANKKCYKMNWEVCTFLRKYLQFISDQSNYDQYFTAVWIKCFQKWFKLPSYLTYFTKLLGDENLTAVELATFTAAADENFASGMEIIKSLLPVGTVDAIVAHFAKMHPHLKGGK